VLDVLVVGTDDWAIEQGADAVASAGHRVRRCHEPGAPVFPCNALRPGGICPLAQGFDVVVSMRARPLSPPSLSELGVICALRVGAPLIVGGLVQGNPFEAWTTGVVDDAGDVPSAIERLGRPAPRVGEVVPVP
jgi:hypothetical protein